MAHVGPELRYGVNNSLGTSHIQEWTRKLLSGTSLRWHALRSAGADLPTRPSFAGAPLALPALFRRLWLPVDPERHSTYAARGSPTETELPKRELLRGVVRRYEWFVTSTVQSPDSTTAHAMSAILQYEELDGLFAKYPKLETGLIARGLAVAVKSTLQASLTAQVDHPGSSTNYVEAAQDVLFQALSQYTKVDGGEVAPVFDVVACRYSIATLANILSRLDPEQACEVFAGLDTLLTTSGDAKPGLIAMGSCVATAAVTASLRAKRAALQDPSVPIKRPKRKSGLLQEVWAKQSEPPTLKFDNLLSIAKQLQGREPISPQLYEALGTAAIALDLGRWQQRRAAPRSDARKPPVSSLEAEGQSAPRAEPAVLYRPADSPVHFIARDSNRALKALRSSQPHSLHRRRQLISSLRACQLLSLTQSVGDVRSLTYSIMFIGKDDWNTAEWVNVASDEVVCAVVDRLVQHCAYDAALQVVRATLASAGLAEGTSKTDTRQMSALFKQPDQMLQFLLESRTSEQAAMKQRCSRVVNVMLNSALVLLSQQHSKQAPVHAIHSVVKALIVLQEHNLALSKGTSQQLLLASSVIQKQGTQRIAALKTALLSDNSVQLLRWRTVFQSLMLAGDDGSAVLEGCENMTAEELVNEHDCSQSVAVAAVYSIMRATDVALSDRLFKARRLLSRLSLSQLETEELPEQIVRAIVAGFFQHEHWLQDVCSHGLLEMNSLLLSAGLPFGRHLQLQLAQHKYEAACGLLRLGVPGAVEFVYKCGLERLLIADQVFARGPAGKKCIARLAATDGPAFDAMTNGGMLDLIPYLSDGYVVSVGHASHPMLLEDMFEVAQTLTSQPQRQKNDLSTFLDVDSVEEDIELVAPLLQNCRAGRVRTPDWLQVHSDHRQQRDSETVGGENRWQPEHFSKLGLLPDPSHPGVVGFGDAGNLVRAIQHLLVVQRMIQAVPPE